MITPSRDDSRARPAGAEVFRAPPPRWAPPPRPREYPARSGGGAVETAGASTPIPSLETDIALTVCPAATLLQPCGTRPEADVAVDIQIAQIAAGSSRSRGPEATSVHDLAKRAVQAAVHKHLWRQAQLSPADHCLHRRCTRLTVS